VLVGPALEGGGFGAFPFHKLARLSDAPSTMTNALAATILRQLGLGYHTPQPLNPEPWTLNPKP
jgi:hypothetical protein